MQHPRLPLTCLCTPAAAHPSPPDSRGCPALAAPAARGFVSACCSGTQRCLRLFSGASSCFQNGALAKRPLVSWGAAERIPGEGEMVAACDGRLQERLLGQTTDLPK